MARDLARALVRPFSLAREIQNDKSGAWQVVLIDRNDYHAYMPLYYEVATALFGSVEMSEAKLRCAATLPLNKILPPTVRFVRGEVQGVDVRARTIELTRFNSSLHKGEKLQYEYLILALGSVPDYFSIPGMATNSYSFASVQGALGVRRKMRDLVAQVKSGAKKGISVVVGGGGATGVEFAAELAHYLRKEERLKILPRDSFTLTLVEAGPRLLGMLPIGATPAAYKQLTKLGVRILTSTVIKKVARVSAGSGRADSVEIIFDKESPVRADMVVWAGGMRVNPVIEHCGLPTDRKGRLTVDEYLQVVGLSGVFAIGDNAILLDPQTKQSVPALAQAAISEGKLVAQNIIRTIFKQSWRRFDFPRFPTVLPLGGKNALTVWGSVRVGGFLGWAVRQAADFGYFSSILPWRSALALFLRGLKVYTRND